MPKKSKMNSENNELYIRMVKVLNDYSNKFSHPIKHKKLAEMDEYNKSLYFRMLCMLSQCENTTNDKQIWFLNRLLEGNAAEEKLEEYTVKALEIDNEDIDAFINAFRESIVRLYFVIDALLVLNLSEMNSKQTEMVANIADFLKISERDLTCITFLTKAILLNDIATYKEAKTWTSINTEKLDLHDYLVNFYQGNYSLNEDSKMLYNQVITKTELSKYNKQEIILYENCFFDVKEDIFYEGCERVTFKNCKFVINGIKDYRLNFKGVSIIEFSGCNFNNFRYYGVIKIDNCEKLSVVDCCFNDIYLNCGHAIINVESKVKEIFVERNLVKNCEIKGGRYGIEYGLFLGLCSYKLGGASISCIDNRVQNCDGGLYGKFAVIECNRKNVMLNENNQIIACEDNIRMFKS